MIDRYASAICRLAYEITNLERTLNGRLKSGEKNLANQDAALSLLRVLASQVENDPAHISSIIPSTASHFARIGEAAKDPSRLGAAPLAEMHHLIRGVIERLEDDLDLQWQYWLTDAQAEYYRNETPFGQLVSDTFPKSIEDASEAAKCLALDRSTAAVFHLMRAMECAVQALSAALKIDDTEREWGKLLSDVDKKIEAMPKGDYRNNWSECHTHLYHVKQAWRNDTMHPKQTYTWDEADAIFKAVRVFMNNLANLISPFDAGRSS